MTERASAMAAIAFAPGTPLADAWALCYMDPAAARALGRGLAEAPEAADGPSAAWGWWHVALAEVRIGDPATAAQAVAQARGLFARHGAPTGLWLCDEVEAIALRRAGDSAASRALQATIDSRPGSFADPGGAAFEVLPLHRFIAHNSRAITHKLLGEVDAGLMHFYAAEAAAEASGNRGARLTALANLGGYHLDLFNLDDALDFSERALAVAQQLGSRPIIATSAANLIVIHQALGNAVQARAMAQQLIDSPDALLPGALESLRNCLALGYLAGGELAAAQSCLDGGARAQVGDGDGAVFWAWVQARVALARGEPARARAIAEPVITRCEHRAHATTPYDLLELLRAAGDACEQLGDAKAALAWLRSSQKVHEALIGRSARARHKALEVRHDLARAERERDSARDSHRSVEADRQRLVELNTSLQAKVAEVQQLHAQLREQALRDPLTGLHNRRYLYESGPGLLELARRNERPLCVALMDLDHFKLLNDTYGHQAGDQVLQRFAQMLLEVLRKSDVIVRHGGEEFVAVMPDIDATGAAAVLARLQEVYQTRPPDIGRRRLPTCSFSAGIALFPRHGQTLDQLLLRADRALYAAKHQGRSRIEHAPATGFSTLC